MEVLIQYLKNWCVKEEAEDQKQNPPGDELEGADFTSTVEHIYNIYTYLQKNCSQSSLKELFQHTPAVFVVTSRCVKKCFYLFICSLFVKFQALSHQATLLSTQTWR